MAKTPEKICRKHAGKTNGSRRYIAQSKKQAVKAERIAGKRDPENAPTKRPYRGWSD